MFVVVFSSFFFQYFNTWLMRALRRRQHYKSSAFISYSKLLLQIFQTNIKYMFQYYQRPKQTKAMVVV